jgi:hypothetical protein
LFILHQGQLVSPSYLLKVNLLFEILKTLLQATTATPEEMRKMFDAENIRMFNEQVQIDMAFFIVSLSS